MLRVAVHDCHEHTWKDTDIKEFQADGRYWFKRCCGERMHYGHTMLKQVCECGEERWRYPYMQSTDYCEACGKGTVYRLNL